MKYVVEISILKILEIMIFSGCGLFWLISIKYLIKADLRTGDVSVDRQQIFNKENREMLC